MNRIEKTATGRRLAAIGISVILLLAAGGAAAQSTIVWLGPNYPSAISDDGSVVVGNSGDGLYETFRWNAESGVVRLGMHTGSTGSGAGAPDVSSDGNHVSATVMRPDSLSVSPGIWSKGLGWQWPDLPLQPDGNQSNASFGSGWGLSGDGSTVVGLYWRSNADGNGSAHAFSWDRIDSTKTGYEAPPTSQGNCRANDANLDGSVVVGWSERPDGVWLPTVWENGTVEWLHYGDWMTEAKGVSDDGNTIWGCAHDTVSNQIQATIWLRNGEDWDQHFLGYLPGTIVGYGKALVWDMTADGTMAVGYNAFDWGQGTGFVWTLDEGMVSGADYLASIGITLPAGYIVGDITGVSDDGLVLTGMCWDTMSYPYTPYGFVVGEGGLSAVPGAVVDTGFAIESNAPNPFNPATTISLSIDREQHVRLEIFDVRGRSVRLLHDDTLGTGNHELRWDGRTDGGQTAASGVYFAHARGETGAARSHRMTMLK